MATAPTASERAHEVSFSDASLEAAPRQPGAFRNTSAAITGLFASPAAPAAPAAPHPLSVGTDGNAARELLDIEARWTIEVATVSQSLAALRALVREHGGQVINEVVSDTATSVGAALSIRIASNASSSFFDSLASLGAIRSREIKATDIGKQYFDAQVVLKNLDLTLARYRDVLAKAQNVKDILAVEAEITRVQTQLDQVKGELLWMSDRAARATIYVTLTTHAQNTELPAMPEAKLYPGVRSSYLLDARGNGGATGLAGVGLSVGLSRTFRFDADLMQKVHDRAGGGLDGFLATFGGDFYSDYLGGGRRTTLNPYLGFRVGYARLLERNQATGTLDLGLDLYRTTTLTLGVDVRLHAFFGNRAGAELGLQPGLGANVAF